MEEPIGLETDGRNGRDCGQKNMTRRTARWGGDEPFQSPKGCTWHDIP
jgi:hypothetical protein